MRRITPYIAFAFGYGALLLLAGLAADQLGSGALTAAVGWLAPFAVAPLALLAAVRLGHLSSSGVAITSAILAVVIGAATVGILIAIAVPAVGRPTVHYIASMFASYFAIGGWRLLLSFGIFVAAPLLWGLLLLSRPAHTARAAA